MTPLIEQLLGDSAHSPEVVARATELYGQVAALLTLGGATAPSIAAGSRKTPARSSVKSGPTPPFSSTPHT